MTVSIALFVLLSPFFVESTNKTYSNVLFTDKKHQWNNFVDNVTTNPRITSLVNLNLVECMIECHLRPRCISVAYRERYKLCTLKRDGLVQRQDGTQPEMFIKKHSWNALLVGLSTTTHSCKINEKLSKDKYGIECVVSDCGLPPSLINGKHEEDVEIGIHSEVTYQCNEGYRPHGISHTGCQSNGEWAPLRVTCITECSGSSDGTEIVLIADDTCSINDQDFIEQAAFYQNLVQSLFEMFSCPRVGFYTHAAKSHRVFGSEEYFDSHSICQGIGAFSRKCEVGNYAVTAVTEVLNDISRQGIILVIADHWPYSGYDQVLDTAVKRNVNVIYIQITPDTYQMPFGDNVHVVKVETASELPSKALDECLKILKMLIYN